MKLHAKEVKKIKKKQKKPKKWKICAVHRSTMAFNRATMKAACWPRKQKKYSAG
jgi:hypothetical protein